MPATRLIDLTNDEESMSFAIWDRVTLCPTAEGGSVRGFKRVENSEDEYLVEYVDTTGCLQERWIRESALSPIQLHS
jgi:hypothetical protein